MSLSPNEKIILRFNFVSFEKFEKLSLKSSAYFNKIRWFSLFCIAILKKAYAEILIRMLIALS